MDLKAYHIWRRQSGKEFKEIEKVRQDQTRFEDDGLNHGTTYGYRLQAEDADGLLSDFSIMLEPTTKPLPRTPTDLEANALPSGFILRWKPNPEPDIATYKIYVLSFLTDKEIGSTEKIPFSITTLDADKEYTVSVTAVDKDGLESNKSEPVTIRTK
jgi:fibronectin type 3 domain-containing protein